MSDITVDGKEGGLYFQIIHNRVVRQLNTDYKVFAEEWDAEAESVIVNGNRSNLLLGIQERLAWDVARLEKLSARWKRSVVASQLTT